MINLPPDVEPRTTAGTIPRRSAAGLILLAAATVAVITALTTATTAQTTDTILYDDALAEGYEDWSWGDIDLTSTEQVETGSAAIRADLGPWGGLSLGRYPAPAAPGGPTALQFSANGGTNDSVTLQVVVMDGQYEAGPAFTLEVPGGRWTTFTVPLETLGSPSAIGGFWWQARGDNDPEPIFFDDIRLTQIDEAAPTTTLPTPTTTEPTTTEPTTTEPPTVEPPATEPPTVEPPIADSPEPEPEEHAEWAFEETFDGDPSAPSQELLPDNFDYVATHRSHPKDHFTKAYDPFLVDHDETCTGPNPEVSPLPQRYVRTVQDSNGSNPDETFFICKNHMMSSMGEVEGYSVSAFWPRQEFNFADGGVLEFEVNINDSHAVRSWWEVMIVPRDQLKVGAGPTDSPISETYPDDRIVLDFRRNVRTIKVGTGALAPEGWLAKETQRGQWDFAWWSNLYPEDPALDDRRIRRTMRIELGDEQITWSIETADGSFDSWTVDVPGGLPFDEGLVLFKTHAYNPIKDGNLDTYTFHWDNIRFDGPVTGRYDVHEADDVVYLQRNGDREIGESETVTIDLPSSALDTDPVLFGQIHQPKRGQVLLSINGGPNIAVEPYEYDRDDCASDHWKSFHLDLDPAWLRAGENTLTWTIGPKPDCADGPIDWNGFSAKFLQIQTAAD